MAGGGFQPAAVAAAVASVNERAGVPSGDEPAEASALSPWIRHLARVPGGAGPKRSRNDS